MAASISNRKSSSNAAAMRGKDSLTFVLHPKQLVAFRSKATETLVWLTRMIAPEDSSAPSAALLPSSERCRFFDQSRKRNASSNARFGLGPDPRRALGPAAIHAASTGRTHDRTRPMLHQRKKALVNQAPSTHDPLRASMGRSTTCF